GKVVITALVPRIGEKTTAARRAIEHWNRCADQDPHVVLKIVAGLAVAQLAHGVLLDESQEIVDPAARLVGACSFAGNSNPIPAPAPRRVGLGDFMHVERGYPHLFEVVLARRYVGRFADLLYSRYEERNQNGNDGDDYQQLNEREANPA